MVELYDVHRWVGKAVHLVEKLIEPKSTHLTPEERNRRRDLFRGHTLYHFNISPFSMRVRRKIASLGLEIPMRDTLEDSRAYEELISQGGKDQVPCMKIEKQGTPVRWMYESRDIIDYLEQQLVSSVSPKP